MIDWTDGFEILSLMGVDKGTRCTYSVFVRWDIMHTEIVHILLVAVEQLIASSANFGIRFHFVSNPRIEIARDNESLLFIS